MAIEREDVFSWNRLGREIAGATVTFGLFPRLSPDGRYVAATVAESVYVQNYTDWRFLQTFYPTRGILAIYDTVERRAAPLRGADDPGFVQSNPVWSPDGRWIVFIRATARDNYTPDPLAERANDPRETPIRYDLCRIPFNGGRGGRPEPLRGASNNGRSNSFPVFSPDGRWIVFVQASNGLLLRPDSRLWIVPADGGEARSLECNLEPMNSWHSFSSNGRWLAFTSKAMGHYTRLFLAHIDESGRASPPVLVPDCTADNRAVNLPEFAPGPAREMRAIGTPAVDYRRLSHRALELAQAGDLATAERYLRESLALKEDYADTHIALGYVQDALDRPEEAVRCYRRALELQPGHPRAHRYWAMTLNKRGDAQGAIAHLRQAWRPTPTTTIPCGCGAMRWSRPVARRRPSRCIAAPLRSRRTTSTPTTTSPRRWRRRAASRKLFAIIGRPPATILAAPPRTRMRACCSHNSAAPRTPRRPTARRFAWTRAMFQPCTGWRSCSPPIPIRPRATPRRPCCWRARPANGPATRTASASPHSPLLSRRPDGIATPSRPPSARFGSCRRPRLRPSACATICSPASAARSRVRHPDRPLLAEGTGVPLDWHR